MVWRWVGAWVVQWVGERRQVLGGGRLAGRRYHLNDISLERPEGEHVVSNAGGAALRDEE